MKFNTILFVGIFIYSLIFQVFLLEISELMNMEIL